jgi:hypothetical protein
MSQEFVLVVFPDSRQVFIDGKAVGNTNRKLEVQQGRHHIRLGPPRNYSPSCRRPKVQGSTWKKPLRVIFEQKGLDVFISYSHHDRKWMKQLRTFLSPLMKNREIEVWDDTLIQPGTPWKKNLGQALAAARVAVLLVTPHFLASRFILRNELPKLLERAQNGGLRILWVYLSEALYEETPIADYQAAHDISKPLDALTKANRNRALKKICQEIKRALE